MEGVNGACRMRLMQLSGVVVLHCTFAVAERAAMSGRARS